MASVGDFAQSVSWQMGDLMEIDTLEDHLKGIDVVIHAAAIVTFSTKNKKKLIETAMVGTANLVNMASDLGIKKFIHIS